MPTAVTTPRVDHISVNGRLVEVQYGPPPCPVTFATQTLGLWLSRKQREVLEAVRDHPKVVVPSCHAAGKTFLSAIVVLWWMFTRKPAYVITTAPTWRQVQRLLWKEIRALHRRLPESMRARSECDLTQLKILSADGNPDPYHYAYGFASDRAGDMPGEHAENMLVVYDEAPGIEDEQFAVMDTYQPERELMIGNPVNATGRFRRAVEKPELGWHTVKISAYDTPNFTGEECPEVVGRQLLRRERVEAWKIEWGEDSAYYRSRVLAEFPDESEDAVIAPLSWVQAARDREPLQLPHATAQVGVDVARWGSNRTSIVSRLGAEIVAIRSYEGKTSLQDVAARAKEAAAELWQRARVPVTVLIDETGVGAGVVDWLVPESTDRIRFVGVNFGARASEPDRFVNWRAEAYWCIRESLRPLSNWPELAITATGAEVERFAAQISTIRYHYRQFRVQIESKDDMDKRGMPSPDEADAVALAVGPVPVAEGPQEIVTEDDVLPGWQAIQAGAARL